MVGKGPGVESKDMVLLKIFRVFIEFTLTGTRIDYKNRKDELTRSFGVISLSNWSNTR